MQHAELSDQERDAIARAMQYGFELQKRGIYDQAAELYAGVLKLAPRHAEALHYLGCVRSLQGRLDEALALVTSALEINSGLARFHINYTFMLNAAGSHAEALAATDRALALEPENADAHFHRGNSLVALGRDEEALAAFERSLALQPNHVDALVNRGNALLKAQRNDEAIAAFMRANELSPGHAGILNNCGQALGAAGRHGEAVEFFGRSLINDPHYVAAKINRTNSLIELGRPADALAEIDAVLATSPHDVRALNLRGLALTLLDRYEEALKAFDAIFAVDPDMAIAYNNRGNAQAALGRFAEARSSFQIAAEIVPTLATARTNEALAYMVAGDFATGLAKYEARPGKDRHVDVPLWLGREPIADKTLLIHFEQGFGDTLQFVRYAKLVAARGARVVVEAQAALMPVLASVPGVAVAVAAGEPLPPCDLRCPMLSLPLAFGTTLDTVPAEVPYLAAPAERLAPWRARFAGDGKRRIGLVWAGNPKHKNDRNRSIAPERLAPLFAVPGVQWIALQPDPSPRDRAWLAGRAEIQNVGEAVADFGDTAAVMAALDLVLSVDTAAVHLAGALARPIWIMLPFAPDWRWLMGRSDSPWYPTARLFRQPGPGDWDAVVAEVAAALAA